MIFRISPVSWTMNFQLFTGAYWKYRRDEVVCNVLVLVYRCRNYAAKFTLYKNFRLHNFFNFEHKIIYFLCWGAGNMRCCGSLGSMRCNATDNWLQPIIDWLAVLIRDWFCGQIGPRKLISLLLLAIAATGCVGTARCVNVYIGPHHWSGFGAYQDCF